MFKIFSIFKSIITQQIIIIVLFISSCWGQKIEFKKIEKPISHSTVYDIVKHDGVLWIATREGLNMYNSFSIKNYYGSSNKNALKSSEINCLLSTKNGLYIGTSLGLNKYNKNTDNFESINLGDNKKDAIKILYQSSKGKVFVGTQKSLFVLDKSDHPIKIKDNAFIKSICEYKANIYWIAKGKKVILMNDMGETIKEYSIKLITEENINYPDLILFKDSKKNIWLGTPKGLFYFDPIKDDFIKLNMVFNGMIESNRINKISEDKDNNLWLGTGSGITTYNINNKTIKHYGQSYNPSLNQLSDKSINALYFDDLGIMWIGTYFGGVNYTIPKGIGFSKLLPGQNTIAGKVVSNIIQDSNKKIWIATEDSGITIFDRKNNTFSYLNNNDGLSSNNIHALKEDTNGDIWIGTFLGGLNKYNPKTKQIEVFKNEILSKNSLSNNYVYSILEDSKKGLWIGTQAGLNIYNRSTKSFSLFKPQILGDEFIYDLLEDKNGCIWICTRFSGIYKYDRPNNKLIHYSFDKNNEFSFNSNQFVSAFQDSKNNIWFGSLNGGLLVFDTKKRTFKAITQKDGLPNNNIYGVIEDNKGFIWITSNNGLTQYNPKTHEFFNFNKEIGLSTNQFNFKSFFKDREGYLYFGSIYGLNYFHPDLLNFNNKSSEIRLTGFKLFNKDVPITKDGVLEQNIDLTKKITLKYSDNVITFEFTTLDFESNSSNNYEYFLEGFEQDWNKVGNKHAATYTNLSPGKYIFKVRTLPSSKGTNERNIVLTINPPFWKSNWAYCFYLILIIASIYFYTHIVGIIHKQKLAVELERIEKEKNKELNNHKLNFFTFISHEFKTPLTLIIASVESYFQNKHSNNELPEELVSVKKSARKLQHLVRQLMEFRKIETDHAELELKKGNIIEFIKKNFEAFYPLLKSKKINYHLKNGYSEYICFFDVDKVEAIINNLISNAIKNTKEGGYIELKTNISSNLDEKNRSMLTLCVKDSGIGMTTEIIEKILDPFFYQDNNSKQKEGSGIGLTLVHSLTKFLEGSIDIDSKVGEGTTINITIPLYLKHNSDSGIIETYEISEIKDDYSSIEMNTNEALQDNESGINNELRILIVEDNVELNKFLQRHFSQKFKVTTANNGADALNKIEKKIPDIVISDVKMPVLSGLTLCKKLKSDLKTSHIPFILLTGQTEETDRLEGLGLGANAYITKPFNLVELDLLVRNLLRSSQNLESRFSNQFNKTEDVKVSNNQEREFIKTVVDMVEENFSDPNFNIELMASKIGVSRSLLHLKMKKAMNTNASDYIKEVRLKVAVNLLKQGFSISEVTYRAGYNDPNYFSRVFKNQFGLSPSAYLQKENNNNQK
ncbi:Signal transduction histidine kinase [Flavobacterium flevense]|uniref:histidine kinase n=1 Tax=Flavobacterium flevense TaxID=983 RepID=A0A4Y4B1J0_9FLAO|nr:hybrid sensor histidine kinase/response regulator transcription factor [Flavobacterium flevense]GEC72754.1 hybrid sensor histidine kinase/response regulator [Flavobacterium flevense]SHM16246.1 Signal transduction histidine kinase [Flavobacterium flevense]